MCHFVVSVFLNRYLILYLENNSYTALLSLYYWMTFLGLLFLDTNIINNEESNEEYF